MEAPDASRGAVPILAPIGRDAEAIAALVERAGFSPVVRQTSADLVQTFAEEAAVAVIAEEALYGDQLAIVERWIAGQPPWSDQPIIVLTNRNEGPKFAAFRRDLVARLRNVTFLERPLQAITLQATVLAAARARARQYEVRTFLEAQQDAAVQLEDQVAARTAQLEAANQRLLEEIATRERAQAALLQAQKIEALGQLVGGVAHDFNNLLMAVIGNLDLMAKRLGPDPRLNRLLIGALEGARRGATLTQRLLAFARKQELQPQSIDIADLVEGIRDLLARSVGPRSFVEIQAEDRLPPVSIDPNQLEMALLNLAVNARDAMPDGGVLSIRVGSSKAPAELPAGEYICLTVADTGAGMDAETLARAIEPFYSTKAVGKGTGLGLSMVSGLAQQSGGILSLESALGQGTVARLWLPIAATGAVVTTAPRPTAAVTPPAIILVVDDDVLIAHSTVALLEDLGHEVIEVNSGAQALQRLIDGLQPDLLITDYAMPEMTGVQLAQAVRQVRPDLPVLLATGFADPEDLGTTDLPRLAKPYTQDQLATEIARLLPQ